MKGAKKDFDGRYVSVWSIPSGYDAFGFFSFRGMKGVRNPKEWSESPLWFHATEEAALEIAKQLLAPVRDERDNNINIGLKLAALDFEVIDLPLPPKRVFIPREPAPKKSRWQRFKERFSFDISDIPGVWLTIIMAMTALILSIISISKR